MKQSSPTKPSRMNSVSNRYRLFKQILKTTLIQYLIKYRLQKAVEEFDRLEGRNIGDIAYSCGFSDATYFNRCFKKEFGCTPTEYMEGRLNSN